MTLLVPSLTKNLTSEAIFLVRLETSWHRARSLLGMSFLMIVPYTSCLARNELFPGLAKNTVSDDVIDFSLGNARTSLLSTGGR